MITDFVAVQIIHGMEIRDTAKHFQKMAHRNSILHKLQIRYLCPDLSNPLLDPYLSLQDLSI